VRVIFIVESQVFYLRPILREESDELCILFRVLGSSSEADRVDDEMVIALLLLSKVILDVAIEAVEHHFPRWRFLFVPVTVEVDHSLPFEDGRCDFIPVATHHPS
jgi:hypothetical protein